MRLLFIFIITTTLLVLGKETVHAQKQLTRLVSESRYYLYKDETGKEYTVPVDSIHYGYTKSRSNELRYIFNNLVDTDKYPETAYLHDPAFYDIYPAEYDTVIKLDNKEDSLLFIENWNVSYVELDEFEKSGVVGREVNLLTNAQTVNKYGRNKLIESRNIYMPDSTGDSTILTGSIQYMYDKAGRLSLKKFVPANAPDSAVGILYYYDANGQVAKIESPNRVVNFSYEGNDEKKSVTAQITGYTRSDSSSIMVRNTYEYDKGDLVLYRQEKKEGASWKTLITDTLTYDNNHWLASFTDGESGLYHHFTLRYNSFGQPVYRTSEVNDEKYTRFLPDGSKVKIYAAECHYYYEFYDRPKH
jgi:hypothetical protein